MLVLASEMTAMPTWLIPSIVIGILVQFLFNGIVAVSIHRSRQFGEQLKGLRDRLHETATKLIDERFRAMSHDLNNHVQRFTSNLDAMSQRLKDGEEEFSTLAERDQKIEIAVAGKFDALKDFLREEMATSEELTGHQRSVDQKFQNIAEQVTNLRIAVGAMNQRPRGGAAHG